MSIPKINMIYYKALLDGALVRFIDEYGQNFQRRKGVYVMGMDIQYSRLTQMFEKYMTEELQTHTREWDIVNPEYYIVIGACTPSCNLLINYRRQSDYFPVKLKKYIESKNCLKYLLLEKDIDIDMKMFNRVFEDIFDKWFKQGMFRRNVFCVKHERLDCYSLFKTLKFIFGAGNCVNMQIQHGIGQDRTPTVSVNDMIDKYIRRKADMNKSPTFITAVNEIREYINGKMQEAYS